MIAIHAFLQYLKVLIAKHVSARTWLMGDWASWQFFCGFTRILMLCESKENRDRLTISKPGGHSLNLC